MKETVELLIDRNETIATMESCTGGGVANAITNVPGASGIIKYSAVTYSNEYKIKMGVPEEVIAKFTVYSKETAIAMARTISAFANADYGVGVTGRFGVIDPANPGGETDLVYISIYDRANNKDNTFIVRSLDAERSENKELVISEVNARVSEILRKKNETKTLKRTR